jgi:hypothetical protein
MIFIVVRWACLLTILFLIFSSPSLAQEKHLSYPGIIHVHSRVSKGAYPLRSLVSLAQDKGIKILVLSDSFLRRWEYGLPIFSNILKVSIEEESVVKYGIKRYLGDFKRIKDEFPDTVILAGVEVAPFYWWSGNPFRKTLTLNDWDRHLLVTGLKQPQDYAHLPVVCNRYLLPRLKDIPFLLIPVALIISGIFILKKRRDKKFLGLTLNIAGILFLLNLFPFSASRYNPYQGHKGFLPYQDLIDYVHKKGGLIFWAHPEVTQETCLFRLLNICFSTPRYPESLILTSGYTGFGVNMSPGTNHNLILAGGEWDNVLRSYCEGKRSKPVWAIGEADYHGPGQIDSVRNIFLLSDLKPESVYEALRNGRLYVCYYAKDNIDISLSDFYIQDSQGSSQDSAFIADKIKINGKPRLRIKGSYKINPPEDLKLEIIRNGEIIKEFEFTPLEKTHTIREDSLTGFSNEEVFDLEFQDGSLEAYNRKSYYRLNFFAGGKIILVTNPIFVEIK